MVREHAPYILLLALNALGLAVLTGLAWRRRSMAGAIPLLVLLLFTLVWSLATALEMAGATLESRLFWNRLGLSAAICLPTIWLIFVFRYIGWREWLNFRFHILLGIEPILATVALWTNPFHLFYAQVGLSADPAPMLTVGYGPLFSLHLLYSSALVLIGLALFYTAFLRVPPLHRRLMRTVILGATLPWLLALLCARQVVPLLHPALTPICFTLMGLIIVHGLSRFHLLDIMPGVREAIFEGTGDGVIVLDADGYIADINPAAQRMVGLTARQAIGQPLEQALPDWPELAERCRHDEPPTQTEISHRHGLACRYYDLRISVLFGPRNHPSGRLVILHDTTAARRSEEQYRALVQNIPLPLYRTTPGPSGKFLVANPAFLRMSGIPSEEELHRIAVAELYMDPRERQAFSERLLAQGSISGEELRLKRWDGTPIIVSVTAQVIYDEDTGEVAFFDCAAEDITGRRRMEETLQRRTAQLEALREVALNLAAELDLEALLHSLATRAIEMLDGSAGGLYLYRPERDELEWSVSIGPNIAPTGTVLRRGEGMAGQIWESGQPSIVDDYRHWAGRAAIYEAYPVHAVVGVPVRWGDEFLGVLEVIADPPRTFTPADADLLALLAAQAAVAIRNANLFRAEREQRALAEALAEAAAAVSGTLDLEQVLDRILDEVARVVNGDAFNVMLIDGDRIRPVRWRGYERFGATQVIAQTAFHLTEMAFLRQMAESGTPVIVPDTADHPAWRRRAGMDWLRSYVAAPILVGGQTVGFLNVDGARPGQFAPADARRLEAFASHAALAIRNARLYQETTRRLAQAQVLRETMLAAARTLDFDQVLEQTMATLQTTMKVDFLGFGFLDQEHGHVRIHAARIGYEQQIENIPLERSICGRVLQTGEAVVIGDVRQSPDYYEGHPEVRSELAVPVRAGQRIIGVLNVESRQLNAFDQDDLAFYTAIAGQLGVALENARLYQEVSDALARLQELDHMKDEFIQNVSHELRMPLALIRGHAEMLEAGELGALNHEQAQSVTVIARRARMMSALVDDITMLLENEARRVHRESLALQEIARAAAEDFRAALAQNGLTLRTEIAPDLPPVSGSPLHLRRVADNLIGNAIKFTPSGGTITVRVFRDGDRVALQVQDTGIGIAADQLDRVFERFYQVDGSLKRRYGGVGLGLALVKEITESYGGRVEVQSQVGQGSTFTVWIPLAG